MTRREKIDEIAAIRIATRTLLEHHRGPCTVHEASFDVQRDAWFVNFRPQLPGVGGEAVVVDGGPLVIVDAETGQARLLDMMSTD